jgi:ABC-type multidrug transport system ATPase subunit/pSer/pThr/pTyr-binding forkhead associated (FHA) protein
MHDQEPDQLIRLTLSGTRAILGRDESCTVRLSGLGVSRRHAAIDLSPSACVISDLNSSFGLRINGQPVSSHRLSSGDIVTLGVRAFSVEMSGRELLLTSLAPKTDERSSAGTAPLSGGILRIGRDPAADLVLAHPLVSRIHATAHGQPNGTFLLIDLNSTNGTYVNGRPVKRTSVGEGDIIQIGPYRLFVEAGRLAQADHGNHIRLEAFGVSVRFGKKSILDNVTIEVPAGEFVAVLGSSGAGKSTLARSLCGRQKIDGGVIYANRLPLKQFLGAFTSQIGYVSQENLLHQELTVAETFYEQCLLRLPRDSSGMERSARIEEVVELLELDHVRHQRIARLSGGEAKRVHLGVELLASPALIVLDEPLAGLDPGLVRKFMRLFRRICDRGHTILLTTHTLEQVEFCDRIVFMHRGTIVFSGQPAELEATFGKTSLADVYEQVEQGRSGGAGVTGSNKKGQVLSAPPASPARAKLRKPHALSAPRQFLMLVTRYATIMRRDRRNLMLMLLQAPLIALFLAFVFRSGSKFLPMSFYFCVTISAIWITGINAVQEIAREWRLLDREYRAGLSVSAYLLSKIAMALVSSLIQGSLFWLFLGLLFSNFPMTAATTLLMLAGTTGGALLGLCISSLSGSVGRANTLLPIVFIPQIFFSGILIPFDRMSDVGRVLSQCTISRPVFSLFKHVCLLEQPLAKSDSWFPLCFLVAVLIILTFSAVRVRCAAR